MKKLIFLALAIILSLGDEDDIFRHGVTSHIGGAGLPLAGIGLTHYF